MRLFVALDIPRDVRDRLAEAVQTLRAAAPQARWVRLEGVHLTLKFIGETPPEKAERVQMALARVPLQGPFDLHFAGLGFFPSPRQPRVLWAGIQSGPALPALAAQIQAALEPLGIAREKREFSPHITLARLPSPQASQPLRAAVENLPSPQFGHATVSEFFLYQSVLKRSGAEYTRLASYPLAARRQERAL